MNPKQNSRISGRGRWPDGWTLLAVAIAVVVVAPMAAVVWIALHPTENIWPHLLSTVLPRYFRTTLILMAGVA
ncbi:MAG: iron ABC transporter permease, partial [Rhodobacteraceae bacterium]|nr:iron ABC transporter permease [Paracoccaceae bacterium]